MSYLILVIEDDIVAAKWVKVYLERAGYSTVLAHDGMSGLEMVRKTHPSLIVLDLMLPGLNGKEICRIVRNESDVPIIMLTALGAKSDRINGLTGGADDYIVKPYDPDELVVRVKTILRRSGGFSTKNIECGLLHLDEDTQEICIDGKPVQLSKAQYSIMAVFMSHPNSILTRNQLIEQAFNNDFESYDRAIDSHIRRLRKLIHRENYKPLRTIYGSGYKLECPGR